MHKLRQGENVETAKECCMISIKNIKNKQKSLSYFLVYVVSIPVEYSVIIFLGLRGEYPCQM